MNPSGTLRSRPDAGVQGRVGAGTHELPDEALLYVPDAPPPLPLLVFFHGAGGDAAGSLPLVRFAAERAGAAVLAPTSRDTTWDLLVSEVGRDAAGLDSALAQTFAQLAVTRVAFSGFSDGGSYALSLGLANGDLVEAVLAFSPGFAAPPAQLGNPRVWISHGTDDSVLPVERCGRRVAAQLQDAGYEVRYEEFPGGHLVPPHHADAAVTWWLAG